MLSLGTTVSVSLRSRSPISNSSSCFLLTVDAESRPSILPTIDAAFEGAFEGALDGALDAAGGGEGALLCVLLVCLDVELCFDTCDLALDLLE